MYAWVHVRIFAVRPCSSTGFAWMNMPAANDVAERFMLLAKPTENCQVRLRCFTEATWAACSMSSSMKTHLVRMTSESGHSPKLKKKTTNCNRGSILCFSLRNHVNELQILKQWSQALAGDPCHVAGHGTAQHHGPQ